MRTYGRAAAVLVVTASLLVASCGTDVPNRPQSTQASAPSTGPRERTHTDQEADMARIAITIGGQSFHATLADSSAARDLLGQLPVTLTMRDHGGVEKTGRLPAPLSLDGQPDGADPGVGDIGYYAPGNDLVLYYGNQSYFDGIVILGQLEGDAAERISELGGAVTATVERLDG